MLVSLRRLGRRRPPREDVQQAVEAALADSSGGRPGR
jgi:hypothetical protein